MCAPLCPLVNAHSSGSEVRASITDIAILLGGAGTATLFLSVDKDTYEQLGITGEKSAFSNSHKFNILHT